MNGKIYPKKPNKKLISGHPIFGHPEKYKGIIFRSQLEISWVKFFDTLNIMWEYEPETFRLSHGERYTPDFKISGSYYEIKPNGIYAMNEKFKYSEFLNLGNSLYLCVGKPKKENIFKIYMDLSCCNFLPCLNPKLIQPEKE